MNPNRIVARTGLAIALWALAGWASAQCSAFDRCVSVEASAQESVATFPGGLERWTHTNQRRYESEFNLAVDLVTAVANGSRATFTSSLSDGHIDVIGRVRAEPTVRSGASSADLSFSMGFTIAHDTRHRLTMDILGEMDISSLGRSSFEVVLSGPQGTVLARDLVWDGSADPDFLASIDALFPAGFYTLSGIGHATSNSQFIGIPAEASLHFSMMPVPEPGTWVLLMGGLVALSLRVRQRRRPT